jgi:hypothetical protein
MAGIGNDQRPANGVQRRKSVEILDRVVRFGFATDNEIPFDHIVGICSESIDIFLCAQRHTAGRNYIRALHRIPVAAVVHPVCRSNKELPLLIPVGDGRKVGADCRGIAECHACRGIRQ